MESVLLIDLADMPSLAALAITGDAKRLVLWHPRSGGAQGDAKLTIARAHAELVGDAPLVVTAPWECAGTPEAAERGLGDGLMLVQALTVARRNACSRIVWPACAGGDGSRDLAAVADVVCAAVDRATCVTELGTIDGDRAVFDLPLIDLEDDQVVDLADDGGVPLDLFWPCANAVMCPPARGCIECVRWQGAFTARGLSWPFRRAGEDAASLVTRAQRGRVA